MVSWLSTKSSIFQLLNRRQGKEENMKLKRKTVRHAKRERAKKENIKSILAEAYKLIGYLQNV